MKDFFRRISSTEIRNVLAILVTVAVLGLTYLLCFKPIPVENKDVVNIVVGFVYGGALAGVIGYYYGASKSTPADQEPQDNSNTPSSK